MRDRLWRLLAFLVLGALFCPLIPALLALLRAACQPGVWVALLADRQLPQALLASLSATVISVGGALFLSSVVLASSWQSARWAWVQARLPWLLAIPHVAFASALLLVFAAGGLLSQSWLAWQPPGDPWGVGLGVALAIKESFFVLWVLIPALGRSRLGDLFLSGRTLGYSRWRCWWRLVLPRLKPELRWLTVTLAAWSLFVVDVALILGPGNPPTLSVLAWQWLSQPDPALQYQGLAACLLLMVCLAGLMLLVELAWRLPLPLPAPNRSFNRCGQLSARWMTGGLMRSALLCLAILALASVAVSRFSGQGSVWQFSFSAWQQVSLAPLGTTVTLALASAALGLLAVLVWLQAGGRGLFWLWLPLLLPVQPLVAGQYQLWLAGPGGYSWAAVLWSHLLWVVPYMALIIGPAWHQRDWRIAVSGRSLGLSPTRVRLTLELPQLARPLLAALAVGFAVSVAQYLPTLYLGGGRIITLTTEAVALSSGGDQRQLAVQSLLLCALVVVAFLVTYGLAMWLTRYRRGLA